MRAAPAVHVAVTRFGLWRAAWGMSTVLGALTIAAWWPGQPDITLAIRVFGWVGVAAILVSAALQARAIDPFELHWTGQVWVLTRGQSRLPSPMTGDLTVAIDLGPWMLLRFRAAAAPRWARPLWLPVQRRGVEPLWHALRCALNSPPSTVGDAAAPSASAPR